MMVERKSLLDEVLALLVRCLYKEAQWYPNEIYASPNQRIRLMDIIQQSDETASLQSRPISLTLAKGHNEFNLKQYRQVVSTLKSEKTPEALFLSLYSRFIVRSNGVFQHHDYE